MNSAVHRSPVATSRLVLTAILVVSAVLVVVSAVLFQAPGLLGQEKTLTDFDAFYIAGIMAERGEAEEAYQAVETLAAQMKFAGTTSFMPWAYPPPYTLVVEGLALMPIGFAFALFTATSFVFYLLVLRRIAGVYLPGVLIATLPTTILVLRTGQNGFLTAGLIGCFLLASARGRTIAGLPLGLMIIKPHLAAGIALLTLMERRWKTMAVAAGVVIVALAIATAVYGGGIWPAFLGGVREAGTFLAKGYYPLFRMSSVYASVWAFGGSPSLALALHGIGALAGVGLLVHVWIARYEAHVVAAVACVASLFVSPYSYDYDLTILGVGIAFVLPDILKRARPWESVGLFLLAWFATGYGMAANTFLKSTDGGNDVIKSLGTDVAWSLASPALILLVAAGLVVLRRAAPISAAAAPPEAVGLAA